MTWRDNERELRERIGVSLQETQLAEKLTVYETLRLFRSFYQQRSAIPMSCCASLSLDEKRNARVGKLSGGQKQRLARRLRAGRRAGHPLSRRADDGTRSAEPPAVVGDRRRVPRSAAERCC